MPILRLRLKQPSPADLHNQESAAFLLANLRNSYFPGKGIPLSLFIHAMLFCILFFLRAPKDMLIKVQTPPRATVIQQDEPTIVMYLPLIGGGDLGMMFPAPKVPKPSRSSPVASSPKPKGLSYPGRQEMVSDPPDPTNQIQTLEQPSQKNLPVLPPPLVLPNIVQIADAKVEPLPEPANQPEKVPEQVKPVEAQPSSPPNQIKPAEPPPLKPPQAPKPAEPPIAKPPKEEKPAEPPLIKPPQPPKPIEPQQPKPPDTPAPVVPPPLPAPVTEPEIQAVAPMVLPFPVAPQISVEVPKVTLPPLVPPKEEKPAAPAIRKEPMPKIESVPKTEPPPKAEPVPKAEPIPQKAISKIPAETSAEMPKPKASAAAVGEKQKETPHSSQDANERDRGLDQQDLLALTPLPAPLPKILVVPRGEARGRFAISPEPNLAGSEMALGPKSGAAEAAPVSGNRSDTPPVDGVPKADPMPPVMDIGPISGSAKNKEAMGADTAKINPKAKVVPGVAGAGAGSSKSGNSRGGATPGQGIGAGVGSGSGPGKKKPFSGITIVGGAYDPGVAADAAPVVQARRPLQTAYGVTVISTENSGGGLPNMGVFSGEQIYTVYLDMRQEESDPAPSWTLEFAIIRDPSNSGNASTNNIRSQEGVVLPFPIDKERPVWPSGLVAKYRGRQILVYATINVEGKMMSITVKDSPDILLNEPLLHALSKWVFRPAQYEGAPVAVKALLGVPLWLPE